MKSEQTNVNRFQNQQIDTSQRESPMERPVKSINDISPFKLNSLKKQSEKMQIQKDIDEDIKMALQYEQELNQSGFAAKDLTKMKSANYNNVQENYLKLEPPLLRATTGVVEKQVSNDTFGRESNPNSAYIKKEEEELKQLELKEQEEIDKQLQNEKEVYKLADYFVTIGIDDFHTNDEMYGQSNKQPIPCDIKPVDDDSPELKKSVPKQQIDLKFLEDGDDFERVISRLEIFVIKDLEIFQNDYQINGAPASVTHPDQIINQNEKWIDLRGDKYIYLKITYDDIKNCRRPITDLNFYKISRFKQQQNKMCIHVKQSIEPIPVKEFGDPEADTKFKKTKKLGKIGDGSDDMYNFYGDYDLTPYFEDPNTIDPQQKKNLCLCISVKKQTPTQDVILVIGQHIDMNNGQIIDHQQNEAKDNITINWDVPEGYKKLAYSVGLNGCLNRLLCLKSRDFMKKKIKPKVLDRYPPKGQDRHYYPFPASISDFCFPSGITLRQDYGQPEFFSFSLTDGDGTHIFGSCLLFDEDLSQGFKEKLKSIHVRNIDKLRAVKAICILSHYSFNNQFKNILKQLYRIQNSNTSQNIPLERYIVNLMEEIPLPDEGKLCVQYDIQGETASFFRPIDQHPPLVGKDEIENLFKCLDVDSILEIFSAILLERKILMISSHKALLTQVINCFVSFIFPFQWKHSLIPILPSTMIDILDAPFPFIIGIEPIHDSEYLDIENDVIRINLDLGQVTTPEEILQQSQMPQMPSKEKRILKQRLQKASEHIELIPDPQMLDHVDLAFNIKFMDPDEDFYINHFEVRDSFLEFMSTVMSGYTKFIKDPSQRPEMITQSKDFFDIDRFRLQKDAKKPFHFIYKLTDTIHFSYFIESRCFGKSDRDHQIMQFDKLINEKRSRMKPRLLFPFSEEKSISTLPPNEEGIEQNQTFSYKIFPKLDPLFLGVPRAIQNYNIDSMKQQIIGSVISNEKLIKMHDSEWARYMLEVIYLLWFQVFCSTLPIYSSHAPGMIDFARKILNYIRHRIKPMRDIEFIYRRLFEACGTTKQINELRDMYKEMIKNKIEPDKVTSGVYYQALLQCKRRAGKKEADQDIRKSYFHHRMEDYQERLNQHQDDENRSCNRVSNLSLGYQISSSKNTIRSNSRNVRQRSVNKGHDQILDSENEDGVDFQDILEQRVTQQTALDTQSINRISSPTRLSYILENSLYFEINKECMKCQQQLREEEIFTGFQKNLSSYTIKCPICSAMFVPKFTIYSETENQYIDGKKGKILSLLPPISLYKDFINAISNNSDQILMSDTFIEKHKIVFWNIILYFKILNLPIFMLDLDYSPYHQKQHCSMIKKFLPFGNNRNNRSFFTIGGRKNSLNRNLPPKLDSNALKKLEQSPQRFGNQQYGGVPTPKGKQNQEYMDSCEGEDYLRKSTSSKLGGRSSSIKKAASSVFNVFGGSTKKKTDMQEVFQQPDINVDPPVSPEFNPQNLIAINQYFPQTLNKDMVRNKTSLKIPNTSGGGVQGIHFQHGQVSQGQGPQSQAVENDRKGIQNMLGDGMKNLYMNLKKPASQKSGSARLGSQKSGPGSQLTSLSDLEKIEKIMNEAKYADKSIVKYFGKHFEEFRRDMHYNKEIVFSDMFTGYAAEVNNQDVQVPQNEEGQTQQIQIKNSQQ